MVKVISLSNEAYSRLKILKGNDKSFSDVVIEVTDERKGKKKLSDFFGIWKDDEENVKKMKKMIEEDRKKFRLREVKF